MPDREKVIRGLECIAGQKRSCEGCPYSIPVTLDLGGFSYGYCAKGNVAKDAIALLREPIDPAPTDDGWLCGDCLLQITKLDPYCKWCGRKVKWK